MGLYCSREIFEALDGMHFPATKEDVLDYAELKDAPEAVLVVLNELKGEIIYQDIEEICRNARTICTYQTIRAMSHAPFPATREELIAYADRKGAPQSVRQAVWSLPPGRTYQNMDDMCSYVL
ncbi:MAG: DUF2795 domain-containing protein [Armatimonadota bacterium]